MTGPQATASVDPRQLCGIKQCPERAFSLFGWPGRPPIPLCKTCGTKIKEVVQQMLDGVVPEWTPGQWHQWIKANGKEHLFSDRRPAHVAAD